MQGYNLYLGAAICSSRLSEWYILYNSNDASWPKEHAAQ